MAEEHQDYSCEVSDDAMKFKQVWKGILNGKNGELIRKVLTDNYINPTSIGNTPEMTYYNLGQKELVQTLLFIADEESK